MSQNPNETVPQAPQPVFVTVRIPFSVDAALEREIAGTGMTKREVVEAALREYLKLDTK